MAAELPGGFTPQETARLIARPNDLMNAMHTNAIAAGYTEAEFLAACALGVLTDSLLAVKAEEKGE